MNGVCSGGVNIINWSAVHTEGMCQILRKPLSVARELFLILWCIKQTDLLAWSITQI